ncbi:NAD-dependent epimerase/dehydratase family protein [uncultured Ruegeria sp.]|uniref:NAD-dependent epimerase/dehydratase family protein n=1 Tax=uncultured Ruegeria sp. TaxID=259304 RepID=UPI00345C3712
MSNPPNKTPRPLGRVLLTGATGMVGSSVLAALLNEKTAREVVSLGRRRCKMARLQTFDIDDCWVSARVISSNNQSKASS